MKHIINTLILVLLGMFSSCQFDPYAGDFTTEQPKKEDVIGVYQFKEQTISQTPIDKLGQKASIILNSNGTYHANNIPDVFGGPDAETHPYISATGKWKIVTIGSFDNSWGNAKSHWGITLTSIDESLSSIGFMGDKSPYKLIVTIDDPDLGMVMIFSKEK